MEDYLGMNQSTKWQKVEFRERKKTEKIFSVIKRMADVILSGTLLFFLSPVFLIIAVAVKLEDGGPVFYRHSRIGKYGRSFPVLKFRTMRLNAERIEEYFTPEQMQEYQNEFKLEDDPRITKTGRFLRVTSMDELPQFLNILKGDMSLVGPRPLVSDELMSKYTETEREKLLSVKPGLTGLWQVSGRNHCTYQNRQRQKVELSYVERQSVWLDITILFKTVLVVLRREGAR